MSKLSDRGCSDFPTELRASDSNLYKCSARPKLSTRVPMRQRDLYSTMILERPELDG